jgi:dinuclear metal center YbgI/SA1388 family protein
VETSDCSGDDDLVNVSDLLLLLSGWDNDVAGERNSAQFAQDEMTFQPRCYLSGMPAMTDLCKAMETIAPLAHAMEWDNVGLLVGRRDAAVSGITLCIDLTSAVLEEAMDTGASAIVAYHPIIFDPRKRVTDDEPDGTLLLALIEAGIAVYCPHTALDAAQGGMSDWLIGAMGEGDVSPIEPASEEGASEAVKIVTYVPRANVDAVRGAISAAGAGRIGDYTHCSAAVDSRGTFMGGAGTNPVVGEAGVLESIDETCLMMVCSEANLATAIAALRSAHPYEEPPVHVIPLAPRPMQDTGGGRLIRLDQPRALSQIIDDLKRRLGVTTVRVAEGIDGRQEHMVIGCCPGAGASMLTAAEQAGATLFVTGELRHHDVLAAQQRGTTVLLAGHTNTERGYLPHLQARLAEMLPKCDIAVAATDVAPWRDV